MTQPGSFAYWAFISYSRRDEVWARCLHRRLEGYRLPTHVRPAPGTGVPSAERIRPVFLDQEELAVSPDLGARLRETLDRSRWLVLLASRASAGSKYVDAEVNRFLAAGRADDVRVIALEDDGRGGAPFPPSLRAEADRTGREPLWLDARSRARPDREAVLRLIAGMLGIGFDVLWQRDRRRRRGRLLVSLAAGVLLAAAVGGALARQRALGERYLPERQLARFREWIFADVLAAAREMNPSFREEELKIDILRTDDLNGDSLLDYFVINRTEGFCGSGGCATEAYLAEEIGRYRMVLDLFGTSTPRTRPAKTGPFREILAMDYFIDGEPVYSVHRWAGGEYDLSHYEFCRGILPEYCEDPVMIDPVDVDGRLAMEILPTARFLAAPADDAPEVRSLGDSGSIPGTAGVVGLVAGSPWYLVELWKGKSAFIRADGARRR